MERYPLIAHVLRTVFNAQDGLSLEASERLYVRMAQTSPALAGLAQELQKAFSDPSLSWKQVLCNGSFEVFDAESEHEAREFAAKILLSPFRER